MDNTLRHRADPQRSEAEAPGRIRWICKSRGLLLYHVFCDYYPGFHSGGYAPNPEVGYVS